MRPGEEAPRGTAELRGFVVAADTGAPIRRAQVRVSAPEAQETRITTTDEQGRFELKELAGGRYTVTASKGGFVTLQYGQRRPSERGTAVDLPAGQTLEKVVIGLPRGSVIAGRIVDEFGEPLTGAQVSVLALRLCERRRASCGPAGQGNRTDDQGAFRVFGLPPGEYYVTATLRDDRGPRRLADDDAPSSGYAPTYYPGTTSAADAQRVTVNLGEEVNGVAFGLTLVPLARVSGRVVGPAGSAPVGPIMALPDDALRPGGGGVRTGQIRADGTFEIAGLAPGRYVLQAGRGRRPTNDLVGRTTVIVAGANSTTSASRLTTPAVATGRVETDTGAPPTFRAAQVRVSAVATDPAPIPFGGGGAGPGGRRLHLRRARHVGPVVPAGHRAVGLVPEAHPARRPGCHRHAARRSSRGRSCRGPARRAHAVGGDGVGQRARRSRRRGARRHRGGLPRRRGGCGGRSRASSAPPGPTPRAASRSPGLPASSGYRVIAVQASRTARPPTPSSWR